jgi:electron transport complex protein RnfE
MGVGYTLAIILMAFFREVLGTGMITIGNIFTSIPKFSIPVLKYVKDSEIVYDFSISLFTTPAGAFIVFGLILAVIAFIKNRKAELKANLAKQEKARKAAELAAQKAQAGGSK